MLEYKNLISRGEMDLPKLAAPAMRALAAAGIKSLRDFTKITEKEFSQLHGIGPNALAKIKTALKNKKISFKINK